LHDGSGHHGILAGWSFAGIIGHAAESLRRQVLDVERFCRQVVDPYDLSVMTIVDPY